MRLKIRKKLLGIPLDTGLSAEKRWKTAYSTGISGRYGEDVGGMGRTWEKWGKIGIVKTSGVGRWKKYSIIR
jgi:hypothetical protein